jgi:hypothetical protein
MIMGDGSGDGDAPALLARKPLDVSLIRLDNVGGLQADQHVPAGPPGAGHQRATWQPRSLVVAKDVEVRSQVADGAPLFGHLPGLRAFLHRNPAKRLGSPFSESPGFSGRIRSCGGRKLTNNGSLAGPGPGPHRERCVQPATGTCSQPHRCAQRLVQLRLASPGSSGPLATHCGRDNHWSLGCRGESRSDSIPNRAASTVTRAA